MKDYLSRYLTDCGSRTETNTRGDELTKLTKPENEKTERGFVSFVSDLPLEYADSEGEIAWRVQAMLPQIPDSGPIPFLVARKGVACGSGICPRCGDPIGAADSFTCGSCGRAVNLALQIAMMIPSKGRGDGSIE
jgi:hypothetical protein